MDGPPSSEMGIDEPEAYPPARTNDENVGHWFTRFDGST